VELEFLCTLMQVLTLDDWLTDQVETLKDHVCQLLRVSSFGSTAIFKSPSYPLILHDVVCPWCYVASHVDITSHRSRGPGLWVCPNCERFYDKDIMEAKLVGLLESVVQAWQSQEITCKKCRHIKTSQIQNLCTCFGQFQVRFDLADFHLVVRVLRSLVGPHGLGWLGEMLDLHEQLM